VTNALDNIDASKCSSSHLSEAGNVATAWLGFNLAFFSLFRNVHGQEVCILSQTTLGIRNLGNKRKCPGIMFKL